MSDSKKRILDMLEEGKISPDEAERLLSAMGEKEENKKVSVKKISVDKEGNPLKGKLIVEIDSHEGDNVRVNLPLKLAGIVTSVIPKDKMNDISNEGVDLKGILDNLGNIIEEIDDDIVNISSHDGDSVRIYVEKD